MLTNRELKVIDINFFGIRLYAVCSTAIVSTFADVNGIVL